jgi:hypothetical protein
MMISKPPAKGRGSGSGKLEIVERTGIDPATGECLRIITVGALTPGRAARSRACWRLSGSGDRHDRRGRSGVWAS